LFVGVPIIGFLTFTLYPLLFSLYASMTKWNGLGPMRFTGFDNYVKMAGDERVHTAMFNTVFLMLGIPIGLILSLVLALALSREMHGTTCRRAVYSDPVLCSLAAVASTWQWAFNGDFSLINQAHHLDGIQGPNRLADKDTVQPAIMMMTIWNRLGYCM